MTNGFDRLGDDNDGPQPDQLQPLQWLDMSTWDDGEPEPLDWSITNLVPREQVGLFSGVGGTGKTTLELLKDVAHVTGLPWFNWMPVQGPVIFVGCEDPKKIWRIRLTAITRYFNTTFKELIADGFHVLNLFAKDATIFYFNKRTERVETTPLYQQIYQAAGDLRPVNISLDPLASIFAGNELERRQVYGLVRHAQALALASGGSVTILSHPSLSGIKNGSGISGNTAWHDAFRFRQYLRSAKNDDDDEPIDPASDNGLRELTFMKNQYGAPIAKLPLRYQRGLFLPETSASNLDKLAEAAKADDAFLDQLDRFTAQGRNVSHITTSPNYAPKLFAAKEGGFSRKQLDAAMLRLFNAQKIRADSYGRASNPHQRIVRCVPSNPPSNPRPARPGQPASPPSPSIEGGAGRTPVQPRTSDEEPNAQCEQSGVPIVGHVIGPEPPGTACAHCGLAYGTVYLYRHSFGVHGAFSSEALHEGCAKTWFANHRNDNDDADQ
jgi:RecA-family ATPase